MLIMLYTQCGKWNGMNKEKNKISGCHDDQADQYDKKIYKDTEDPQNYIREKYFEVHSEVLRMADLKNGESALDIGIGTGLLEEKIKTKVKIYGIDISKKMLSKIKGKKINISELKHGTFTDIPFKDKMFDVIFSCFAFHHLSDIEKAMSLIEMKRVLRETGRIVIGDFMYFDERSKKELIKRFRKEKRKDMIEEMSDENFTNVEIFKRGLEESGFGVEYKQVSTISWIVIANSI